MVKGATGSRPQSPGQPPQRRGPRGAAAARRVWREQLDSYLDHHRRTARNSLQRLWQSPLASMMTGLVLAIALALPVALLLILGSLQEVSSGWEDSARISVYLDDDASAGQAEDFRSEWLERAEIASIRFIHRDEALAEFRADSGLGDALDYLDNNPLPHTLVLTPASNYREEGPMQTLMSELADIPAVAQVQMDMEWLQRLNAMADLLRHGVMALGLLLGIAVILVIGNTIRLAIENRRSEIVVVKLVGGTDTFVRRPFLYTGIWYGLLGGLLAWWLVEVALWWLSGPVDHLATLYASSFELLRLPFTGILGLLALSMLFGWLGAWLAVKRHLTLIEPE